MSSFRSKREHKYPFVRILPLLFRSAMTFFAWPPVLNFGSCVDNSRIGDLLKALSDRIGVQMKDLPVLASAPENIQLRRHFS